MDSLNLAQDPPPFWNQFGFFFKYMQQEQLYYQITLLAAGNILLLIPSLIIGILVGAILFLASYKLAFEVLHAVSSGQLHYADNFNHEIDDKIGFKAICMAVIQLLIFLFIYRYDPPVGMALLVLTTVVTPAFLMMLSKTQDLASSFNPNNLIQVISRTGFEYVWLLVFFLLCGALNIMIRTYLPDVIPGIIGDLMLAWILYFLLVFTFLVIGYVMYRHADELGHHTIDTEVVESTAPNQTDPIKERIIALLAEDKGEEAIKIIQELKAEDNRTDLDHLLSQAETQVLKLKRQRPVDQLERLVQTGQHKQAIAMMLEYLEDGHLIKPKAVATLTQLIQVAYENNQFDVVLKLSRDLDKRYPLEHQAIVDNYFLVAKIFYQQDRIEAAKKLLQSLLKRYANSANTAAVSSYLAGINKLKSP